MGSPRDWSWKSPDLGSGTGDELLYEPGNWGDVLKGTWALAIADHLARAANGESLACLDPCAGAPSYPLSRETAARLASIGGSAFAEAQVPFSKDGRIGSTATLVRERWTKAGLQARLLVFDAGTSRRRVWEGAAGVEWLDVDCGSEALAGRRADLVVVDPYDVFDHWGKWLGGIERAARRAPVLVYLYNKAPRSAGALDQYRRLAARLRAAATGGAGCLGRLPSDAVLPRAWHEVVLLGPRNVVEAVRETLASSTRDLAREIAARGAFEELG